MLNFIFDTKLYYLGLIIMYGLLLLIVALYIQIAIGMHMLSRKISYLESIGFKKEYLNNDTNTYVWKRKNVYYEINDLNKITLKDLKKEVS